LGGEKKAMKMHEKYPEINFEHWLAMFTLNNLEWTEENFKNQIEFYKKMESEIDYSKLQDEIMDIIKNNDLVNFLSLAQEYAETELTLNDLTKMAHFIIYNK